MDLDNIRKEIDKIDDQIVQLLEERMHLVEGVVAYKKASGKPIQGTPFFLPFERLDVGGGTCCFGGTCQSIGDRASSLRDLA